MDVIIDHVNNRPVVVDVLMFVLEEVFLDSLQSSLAVSV